MLALEQIKEYFSPQIARLNPKGVLVEYLQYECLDSLFKLPDSENLSFIGGTAIRIVYNNQRFSEDLDFDNFGLSFPDFQSLAAKSAQELKKKGFDLEFRFVEKDETFHCYFKFPGLLGRYAMSRHPEEKIFLSVDAQRKKPVFKPEAKIINKFGIFRTIRVNPAPILLSQKLIAVLERKRPQGRDFYDASFLSALTKPDYPYIESTAGLKKSAFIEKLTKRCESLNYVSLANDVAPFLFDAGQKERILMFKKTLETIF